MSFESGIFEVGGEVWMLVRFVATVRGNTNSVLGV